MNRKKILIISKSIFSLTGSALCCQDIIKAILKNDDKVTILSLEKLFQPISENSYFVKSKFLTWIIYHKKKITKKSYLNLLYWKIKYPFMYVSMKRKILKSNVNHIIINSIGSLYIYKNINSFLAKKITSTLVVHETIKMLGNDNIGDIKKHYQNDINNISNFVFVSSSVRNEWIDFFDIDVKKTFYIPNTINEESIHDLENLNKLKFLNHFKLKSDIVTILCVASIQFRKGQDLLLRAAEKVWEKGYEFQLVFVGDVVHSDKKNAHKQIKDFSSRYPIYHFSSIKPISALEFISCSDILVLPSRTEALPRVILEGMALKKPIIASAVGGVSELIENNVQGLVFNAEDINQLSNYMEILLNDNLIKKNLSEKAHEKYWNFYSRKIYNKNWSNFLDRFD